MRKAYQYKTELILDRGFLDDPEFLAALNMNGVPENGVACPMCGKVGTCKVLAHGWKHRTDQPKGGSKQLILLEREVEFECRSTPETIR